jgi:hypothetical protein
LLPVVVVETIQVTFQLQLMDSLGFTLQLEQAMVETTEEVLEEQLHHSVVHPLPAVELVAHIHEMANLVLVDLVVVEPPMTQLRAEVVGLEELDRSQLIQETTDLINLERLEQMQTQQATPPSLRLDLLSLLSFLQALSLIALHRHSI